MAETKEHKIFKNDKILKRKYVTKKKEKEKHNYLLDSSSVHWLLILGCRDLLDPTSPVMQKQKKNVQMKKKSNKGGTKKR